ncbi:MAG: alpha/beta fold hydrolase [Gammaproteobacteria bacterium]|nr:alpha/beta fold hydrolase [Gammaproteobacteria bacterium]
MNAYEQSQSFAEINNISLHYSLEGDEKKPLLALINMASHNLTCWEVVLNGLLEHFRVLRFDIRGTGRSGWGADTDFTFSQYADDLAGLMDALSLPPAFVLGVAYGARTAARFALQHPEKLTGLALFDVSLTPPVEQTGQRELGAQARAMLEKAGEPAVELQKYWRFYENRDAAFKTHTAHQGEADMSEKLGGLEVPVLVVCGRQDMNLAEAQRIADNIPGADFRIMEMTGHSSPFYRPGLFARIVIEFKTRLVG